MAKSKISMKGGRCFSISELEKEKPKATNHVSKRSLKRRAAKAEAESHVPSSVPKRVGHRTHRADALLLADHKRSLLQSGGAKTEDEKKLEIFCNGRTSGKQKFKGSTKDPQAFPKTSQCAPDVFYADSKHKWGVEKYIDPIKEARVK